jgi:hypothetical protein
MPKKMFQKRSVAKDAVRVTGPIAGQSLLPQASPSRNVPGTPILKIKEPKKKPVPSASDHLLLLSTPSKDSSSPRTPASSTSSSTTVSSQSSQSFQISNNVQSSQLYQKFQSFQDIDDNICTAWKVLQNEKSALDFTSLNEYLVDELGITNVELFNTFVKSPLANELSMKKIASFLKPVPALLFG